jgi:hypothetical protein
LALHSLLGSRRLSSTRWARCMGPKRAPEFARAPCLPPRRSVRRHEDSGRLRPGQPLRPLAKERRLFSLRHLWYRAAGAFVISLR